MRRPQLPIARIAAAVALFAWLVQRYGHSRSTPIATPAHPMSSIPEVWAADARPDGAFTAGMGRKFPSEPYKGQRKPPCAGAQVSINGGCWYEVVPAPGSTRPGEPCTSEMYERGGKCFIPVLRAERPPTTIQEKP